MIKRIQLALDALKGSGYYDTTQQREAIAGLESLLAEIESAEPVAWMETDPASDNYEMCFGHRDTDSCVPLYLHPQPAVPDCKTCINRGKIYGLSQEVRCDHCRWQCFNRMDLYKEE